MEEIKIETIEVKRRKGRPRKVEGKHSKDKDVAQAYQQEYYTKNKSKLLTDMTTKNTCKHCNSIVSKCNMSAHQKSKKCVTIKNNNLNAEPFKEIIC